MLLVLLEIQRAGSGIELDHTELAQWPFDQPVTLYRHGDIVSTFEELNIANGYTSARHSATKRNNAVARRVENGLRILPGVIQATATGELRVAFIRVRYPRSGDPAGQAQILGEKIRACARADEFSGRKCYPRGCRGGRARPAAAVSRPAARSGGGHPKSAKARNRGRWGT